MLHNNEQLFVYKLKMTLVIIWVFYLDLFMIL